MSWQWSHTQEAYDNVRENIFNLNRKTILICLREFRYKETGSFRLDYNERRMSKESLAELLWDKVQELKLCSNGGHRAYICPDGCHTVSFDLER
jgi:hypothetical protein